MKKNPKKILVILFLSCLVVFSARHFAFADQTPKKIPAKDEKTGLFVNEVISVDELKKQLASKKKPVVFDARSKKSFDELHIRGAKLPLSKAYYDNQELFRKGIIKMLPEPDSDLAKTMKKYRKDTPIVTYCNDDCQASSVLLLKLKKMGFKNVKALRDGIQTWQAKGGPVTSNGDPRIPAQV